MRALLIITFICIALGTLREPVHAASGATFIANSTADKPDMNPGDGSCLTKAGNCTLRAAVMEANALPGKDRVRLASATYVLERQGVDDNALRGDLDVTSELTLSGPRFGNTIVDAGGQNERALVIFEGAKVNVSNLTIRNAGGGAIWNRGTLKLTRTTLRDNGGSGIAGGGLYNWGTATVLYSTLRNNEAFQGGAIFNNGTLVVDRSVAHNNTAIGLPAGTQDPGGGGLWNSGPATILNTTLSSNRTDGHGGGIYNWGNNVKVEYSTIVLNRSNNDRAYGGDGGGLGVEAGQALIYNTILANNIRRGPTDRSNFKDDCKARQYQFDAFNSLIKTATGCIFASDLNLTGKDPQLEPLANNGGVTVTHALKATSPAIDLFSSCAGGSEALRDQRNYTRPEDGDGDSVVRCDAGAFEYGGSPQR